MKTVDALVGMNSFASHFVHLTHPPIQVLKSVSHNMNGLTRDEAIDLHTELLSKLTRVNLAVSALTRTADKIDSVVDRLTALEAKVDTLTKLLEQKSAEVKEHAKAPKRARSHSPRSSPPPPFEPSPPAEDHHEDLQLAIRGALTRLQSPSLHQVKARLTHCLDVLHLSFVARAKQVSNLSARPMAALLSHAAQKAQGFQLLGSFFFARLSSPKVLAMYNTASAKSLLDSHAQCRAVDMDDVGAYLLCVERKVEGKVVDMAYAGGATKSFAQRWTQHQQEQEKRLSGQERAKGHLYHMDNSSWAMLADRKSVV